MIDPKVYSLIKVAETGSYTRAAEQLSLTQPAVSQHIRAMESELGIRIFERVNNELRITHEGETAIKYAKRMLSLYNNLQRDLTSEKRQLTQLTVGITHTAESNAISEALAKYVNNHEGVTVKIITDTLSNLYDKVKNYELDFAIVEGKLNHPSLRYLMLDTDCLVLAVSPNHRLAKQSMVTISALKKEKMIEKEIERVEHTNVGTTEAVQALLESYESTPLTSGTTLAELIRRPELSYEKLAPVDNARPELPYDVKEQVDINIKYDGYIKRQMRQVEQFKKLENKRIPENINYDEIQSLRLEAKQKLNQIRPSSIGQASRISGVSPADVSVLLVYLSSK